MYELPEVKMILLEVEMILLGLKNDLSKTLRSLKNVLGICRLDQEFLTDLQTWVDDKECTEEEKPSRVEARERIIEAMLESSEGLKLVGLNLSSLPPEIGKLTALRDLDLSFNLLTTLPPEIGELTALRDLDLSSNFLTTFPDSLLTSPEGLRRNINSRHNQISQEEAIRLSELASARAIVYEILLKAPEEKREELKALLDSEELCEFKLFLTRCPQTAGWESHKPEMIECLFKILKRMSVAEAAKLKYENLASTANGSCADRIGLTLVHMQLELNSTDKKMKDMDCEELLKYARQRSLIQLIFETSEDKIEQLKVNNNLPDRVVTYNIDPIETHLDFLLRLGKIWGLEFDTSGMKYRSFSHVTDDDLKSAQDNFEKLDHNQLAAKYLYTKEEIEFLPDSIAKIINEVSRESEESSHPKKGELDEVYTARMRDLQRLVVETTIAEIASKLRSFVVKGEGGTPSTSTNVIGVGGGQEQKEWLTI